MTFPGFPDKGSPCIMLHFCLYYQRVFSCSFSTSICIWPNGKNCSSVLCNYYNE